MLYLHAWQSYLWNAVASARIAKYGADKAVAGDLVLVNGSGGASAVAGGAEAVAAEAAGSAAETATAAVPVGEEGGEMEVKAGRLGAVHVVTEAEGTAGGYSIRDVVLPLPGSKVQYPEHEAGGELYRQLAAADGVVLEGIPIPAAAAAAGGSGSGGKGGSSSSSSRQGHKVKDFSLAHLTGDYRRLLHVPEDLRYSFVRYGSPNEDGLVLTDWQVLVEKERAGRKQQRQQERDGVEQGGKESGRGVGEGGPAADGAGEGGEERGAKRQKVEEMGGVAGEMAGEGNEGPAAAAAAEAAAGDRIQEEGGAIKQEQGVAVTRQGEGVPMKQGEAAAVKQEGVVAMEVENTVPAPAAPANTEAGAAGTVENMQVDNGVGGAVEGGGPGEGGLLGLQLEFSLPASCYATMLVRELTKESTSKDFHKGLTEAAGGGAGAGGGGSESGKGAGAEGEDKEG